MVIKPGFIFQSVVGRKSLQFLIAQWFIEKQTQGLPVHDVVQRSGLVFAQAIDFCHTGAGKDDPIGCLCHSNHRTGQASSCCSENGKINKDVFRGTRREVIKAFGIGINPHFIVLQNVGYA
ncbi:hypothetical protein D3C87_1259260 [compost metagenome]